MARFKSKTIGPDDYSVLEFDPVANLRILPNRDVGMCYKIAADADAAIDRDVRVERGVVSQFDAFIDETKGPDARIYAKADIFANYGGGMYPWLGRRGGVE